MPKEVKEERYNPSAKEVDKLADIYREVDDMIKERNRTYRQFNDRTLIQFIDDSDKRVQDDFGNIYKAETDNAEVAEMELDRLRRLALLRHMAGENYPEEYEKDLDEMILLKAEQIKKRKNK